VVTRNEVTIIERGAPVILLKHRHEGIAGKFFNR